MTPTEEKAHRLRPYPSYKDSGVEWIGEIPEGWDMRRFKDVMILNPRKSERALPAEVSFVPMEAVSEDGLLDASTTRNTAEVQVGYTYFTEGDLLIAKVTPCFENGKGAVATELCNGVGFGSTEFHVLRGTQSMSATYAYYLTMADGFRKLGESSMYGAGGQKRVSTNFMREVVIPKPPAEEQQAIAVFLDRETARIDELMREQEALLNDLSDKRQATITHAVTKGLDPNVTMKPSGVEWIGEIPEDWNVLVLHRLCSVKARLGWKALKAEEYTANGYAFLATPNIKHKYIDFDNVNFISEFRYLESPEIILEEDDVLLAKDGSTLGTVNVVRELKIPSTVNSSIAVLRTNKKILSGRYLYYYISSAPMQATINKLKDGMGVPHLFQRDIRRFSVLVPSLEEQQAIAAYLDGQLAQIDELREEVRANIEDMRIHRSALITAAVTGKIDVREAE